MIFNSEKLSKVCINQNVRSIIWVSKSVNDFNDLQNTVVLSTRPGDFYHYYCDVINLTGAGRRLYLKRQYIPSWFAIRAG